MPSWDAQTLPCWTSEQVLKRIYNDANSCTSKQIHEPMQIYSAEYMCLSLITTKKALQNCFAPPLLKLFLLKKKPLLLLNPCFLVQMYSKARFHLLGYWRWGLFDWLFHIPSTRLPNSESFTKTALPSTKKSAKIFEKSVFTATL